MNSNKKREIAVLGIGNILLTDEGVGVHVIEALKNNFVFPENVKLIDGGTMGLDLIPFIEGTDKTLIIDAVDIKQEPGSTVVIEENDIPSFLSTKLSVHQIGLPDLLIALKLLNTAPRELCLIGIQPKCIGVGLSMSPEIQEAMETLIAKAVEKLRAWGIHCVLRSSIEAAHVE